MSEFEMEIDSQYLLVSFVDVGWSGDGANAIVFESNCEGGIIAESDEGLALEVEDGTHVQLNTWGDYQNQLWDIEGDYLYLAETTSVLTNPQSGGDNYAVLSVYSGASNQTINFIPIDDLLVNYNANTGITRVSATPGEITIQPPEASIATSGAKKPRKKEAKKRWEGGLEPGFTQFRTFIYKRRNYVLLYKETGRVRFYHTHHGRKAFVHEFMSENWPQNLKRLPTFRIKNTNTEGLIMVLPDNTKQYCKFDLKDSKGYQLIHSQPDDLDWTGHLAFGHPKLDYAIEFEYSLIRGQFRISNFRLDPEFESEVIYLSEPNATGLDEHVVYSFEEEGHTYWRVLLVRKSDGHILVVTFDVDPKDLKKMNFFHTSTYEWADRKEWDSSDAFTHRRDTNQYLLTFHKRTGRKGLFKVENDKENIKIHKVPMKHNDTSQSSAPQARGWTHHAIMPTIDRIERKEDVPEHKD